MNPVGRYSLSLWAACLLTGFAAAQGPTPAPPLASPNAGPAAALPIGQPQLVPFELDWGTGSADRSGLFAGAGFYLLQPHFQNNPAYTVFLQQTLDTTLDPTNPNTQTTAEAAKRVQVRHHMVAAPLVWLGYMNDDGFGVRVRGWGFQEGTNQTVSLPPFAGPFRVGGSGGQTVIVASGTLATVSSAAPLGLQAFGDTLSVQHGPEATTLAVTTKLAVAVGDLEVIQRARYDECTFLFSGGLRYARLDQAYNAYDAQSTSAAELRTLLSGYKFEGLGPTLAVELRRPVGDCGLGVYGMCRGSLVFGSADQHASFFGQELRNDDPNPQTASQQRDRAIPIVDLELGLEYGRAVGNTWLFGQVAAVGQEWFNAGSASRSTPLTPATTLRPVLGRPIDSNLSFLGLTVRLGLNY